MRWYVNRNGQTMGPVEEAELAEAVRKGFEGSVRDEMGGQWMPVASSPFAALMPKKTKPAHFAFALLGTTLFVGLLLGPFLAVSWLLFFLGIGLASAFRMHTAGVFFILLGLAMGAVSLALFLRH